MFAYVSLNKGVKFITLIGITCVFGVVMGLLGFC